MFRSVVFLTILASASLLADDQGSATSDPVKPVANAATLQGACNNNRDKRIAINPYNEDFAATLAACAAASLANTKETSQCIQEDYPGLSQTCAQCFGQVAYCTKENCLFDCMFNRKSPKCLQCSDDYCRKPSAQNSFSLITCTGLTPEQLPPPT